MALLTTETVAAYTLDQLRKTADPSPLPLEAPATAKEIEGGNLNYAFCVESASGESVFVKQAPDFIKVFGPEAKLAKERMVLEVAVYGEMAKAMGSELANKVLPNIHSFDEDRMAVIMDFLGNHVLLQEALYAGQADCTAATAMGELMGVLHARTHSSKVAPETSERLKKEYENAGLRSVQLEHVFTKPFRDSARAEALRADDSFCAELEALRAKYRGEETGNLALLHGDLHPGSVMANGPSVKIIDPEFAIYGPPGLDVGSLLSGYILAYMYHVAMGASCAGSFCTAIAAVWTAYSEALVAGGLPAELVSEIAEDTVCFAACEVARTALGCAGQRGIPLKDEALLSKAEEVALSMARKLILERKGKGMSLLLSELEQLGSGNPFAS